MASRVTHFSDLIHRVTASCLLHPLAQTRHSTHNHHESSDSEDSEQAMNDDDEGLDLENDNKVTEMELLMVEVFESVSSLKKAYVTLQEAHSPWDQQKMSSADVMMVAELKKLGVLKEKWRRRCKGGGDGGRRRRGFASLKETVAPYEAAMEELKRDVKAKDLEVESLKEKLRLTTIYDKKGKLQSRRRAPNSNPNQALTAPTPELFTATMNQVKEASRTFTSHLLSLMKASNWDISAAVRSIESATSTTTTETQTQTLTTISPQHAKYALQSYVSTKMFHGFDHETFYLDGSLSSLLQPEKFRRDCFNQFKDFKGLEPAELLGILPTCHFGKFCSLKFLSIVHPKMEESLFGDLEHHRVVSAGNHPRSEFYGGFLGLAKAVWLLHLVAFALEPSPCLFQASRGGEFNGEYMESVVRFVGGRGPMGQGTVGFMVSPGFKLGNGSVVKARVYPASRT